MSWGEMTGDAQETWRQACTRCHCVLCFLLLFTVLCSFLLPVSSLVVWWFLLWSFFFFLFSVCIIGFGLWFPWGSRMCVWGSRMCVCVCVLWFPWGSCTRTYTYVLSSESLKFKLILKALHVYTPCWCFNVLLYLFHFRYPLPTHCTCSWFYYLCLWTLIPAF